MQIVSMRDVKQADRKPSWWRRVAPALSHPVARLRYARGVPRPSGPVIRSDCDEVQVTETYRLLNASQHHADGLLVTCIQVRLRIDQRNRTTRYQPQRMRGDNWLN